MESKQMILQISSLFRFIWLIFFIFFHFFCQSPSKVIRDEREYDETYRKYENPKPDKISLRTTGITDWSTSKEGFLDSSTFQIKVSSLKTSKSEAQEEALDVAKRKALRLLLSEANPNLSPEGKIDLRILIEEYGKIISDSEFVGEKYLFLYQIKRPALEIIVKEKLK